MKYTIRRANGAPRQSHRFVQRLIWCLPAVGALALAGCDRANSKSDSDAVGNRQQAEAPPVDYAGLDLNRLAETQKKEWNIAQTLTNDEAAVHYAWSGVMTNLQAARTALERQARILEESDILNLSKITNGSQSQVDQQFTDRRFMANAYGDAVERWRHVVSTLSGASANELLKWQVSPDRFQAESQRLNAIVSDRIHNYPINLQLQNELRICEMQKQLALQYNYAVGSMQSYYRYQQAVLQNNRLNNNSPVPLRTLPWEAQNQSNPAVTQAREEFEKRVAEIEKIKQSVKDLRQAAVNPAKSGDMAAR